MAEWQWLMMPVKCLGKVCKNCPNIEIEVEAIPLIEDGKDINYEINLSCIHIFSCLRIKRALKDGDQN